MIDCVVGARPNFMKIAPIVRALNVRADIFKPRLIHTGQHYDAEMQHQFFEQLQIPQPDIDLGVGSGTHAVQTAEIMRRFEPILEQQPPHAVLVVGDVNSTIACALVAVKKGIPVVHVEAGLRSYDRTMPEEINRVLTDQISDILFTTERGAKDNLLREGIAPERIHFVGNVMIDTLMINLAKAVNASQTLGKYHKDKVDVANGYGIVTLHRPSNVDDPATLQPLLSTLRELSGRLPLIFPLHPRTAKRIEESGFAALIDTPSIIKAPPLGYLELLGLMKDAKIVMTDSGGIQEETTALGVPCITLRENTERPITVTEGTNTVVGTDPDRIRAVFTETLQSGGKGGRVPEYWDGKSAERIVDELGKWLGSTT